MVMSTKASIKRVNPMGKGNTTGQMGQHMKASSPRASGRELEPLRLPIIALILASFNRRKLKESAK